MVSDADLQVDSTPTMEKNRAVALPITQTPMQGRVKGGNCIGALSAAVRPPDDLRAQPRSAEPLLTDAGRGSQAAKRQRRASSAA
jgi:hypothetical protein